MSERPSLVAEEMQGVVVVRFREASILESITIKRIGEQLDGLLAMHPGRTLLLDFADVRFLSSQALGVLLTARKKADATKTKLAMSAIRPELMRVFKITKLDRLFTFFDTRDAALAKLGEP